MRVHQAKGRAAFGLSYWKMGTTPTSCRIDTTPGLACPQLYGNLTSLNAVWSRAQGFNLKLLSVEEKYAHVWDLME